MPDPKPVAPRSIASIRGVSVGKADEDSIKAVEAVVPGQKVLLFLRADNTVAAYAIHDEKTPPTIADLERMRRDTVEGSAVKSTDIVVKGAAGLLTGLSRG